MTTTSPVTGSPTRTRPPRRRWPRYVAAAAFTALAILDLFPDHLGGLDRWTPFAQLVAFRPYHLVVFGLVGLALLVATVFRRRLWPFAAGLLAVAAVGASIVAPRLVAEPSPPTGGPTLTVLSFNVYEGSADPAVVADVILRERPDLVSLPEAGARYRDRIAPLVAAAGYRAWTSTPSGVPDDKGVVMLVAGRLGAVDVTIGHTTEIPYLVATGAGLGSSEFVAIHPRSPWPGRVDQWRSDIAQLATWCAASRPAIVAGDLNATFDHSILRDAAHGCADAAQQRGVGLTPTWGPFTRGIGPQIDHVLSTGGFQASEVRIFDLARSDHRAVLVRLSLPPGQAGSAGAGAGTGAAVPSSTGSASTP